MPLTQEGGGVRGQTPPPLRLAGFILLSAINTFSEALVH